MKIAIIGTHGIGKTTLAYMLAAEGQKRGKSIRIIQEVARRCPFPLNDNFSIDGAEWIITSQINRELQAKADGVKFLVCDRSAYDPICYLNAGNHPRKSYEKLKWYAEEWMKTYDKILFVIPGEEDALDDGFRSLDPDFQKDVHEKFMEFAADIKLKTLGTIDCEQIFKNDLKNYYEDIFS